MAGNNAKTSWNVTMCIGAGLAFFSFVTVTYQIYTARWWFTDIRPDYGEPPTISRAIVEIEIREPFAFWITISSVFLVICAAVLIQYYRRLAVKANVERTSTKLGLNVGLSLAFVLQIVSGWGMYTLSTNSLFAQNEMHMVGSYAFFAAQAFVILIYGIWNTLLLSDPAIAKSAKAKQLISRRWVKLRLLACVLAVGMTCLYLVLFLSKSDTSFDESPALIFAYTGMEVAVITAFLIVVVIAFADKLRRPVDI